jgi:signal transduction histidine kinase
MVAFMVELYHSSTQKVLRGLGLGLTLARHLTVMHGGTVEASSPGLGEGSEFVVRLPVLAVRPSDSRLPPGQRQGN